VWVSNEWRFDAVIAETPGGFSVSDLHHVNIVCRLGEPYYFAFYIGKRVAHYGDRIPVGQWKVSVAIDGRPAFSFAGDGAGLSHNNSGPGWQAPYIQVELSDEQVAALTASRTGLLVAVENKTIGNQSLKFGPPGLAMTVLTAACDYDPKRGP
jgi:hypothetical protein